LLSSTNAQALMLYQAQGKAGIMSWKWRSLFRVQRSRQHTCGLDLGLPQKAISALLQHATKSVMLAAYGS
jgi:hypothetical protein